MWNLTLFKQSITQCLEEVIVRADLITVKINNQIGPRLPRYAARVTPLADTLGP